MAKVEEKKDEVISTSYRELKLLLEVCNIIAPEFVEQPELDAKNKVKKKPKRTPFEIGITSFLTRFIKPIIDDLQQDIVSINNKYCRKDADGCIIYDEKDRLIYTAKDDEDRRNAIKTLEVKKIELPKRYVMRDADCFPENISVDDKELLEKFIRFA